MAVAVPVVTKLVEQQQDVRNKAAGSCPWYAPSNQCPSDWDFDDGDCVTAEDGKLNCCCREKAPEPEPVRCGSADLQCDCNNQGATRCINGQEYHCGNDCCWHYDENKANNANCAPPTIIPTAIPQPQATATPVTQRECFYLPSGMTCEGAGYAGTSSYDCCNGSGGTCCIVVSQGSVCTPGETKCSNGVVSVCNTNGEGWTEQPCASGVCQDATSCVIYSCPNYSENCKNGPFGPADCSALGLTSVQGTCPNNGTCCGRAFRSCEGQPHGTIRCNDTSVFLRCEDGSWIPHGCASGRICPSWGTSCQAPLTPTPIPKIDPPSGCAINVDNCAQPNWNSQRPCCDPTWECVVEASGYGFCRMAAYPSSTPAPTSEIILSPTPTPISCSARGGICRVACISGERPFIPVSGTTTCQDRACCVPMPTATPTVSPATTVVPTNPVGGDECGNKTDITGATNPACCSCDSDCPYSAPGVYQECNIPNGYCNSGSSCNPNPEGKFKKKCAWDASQGQNICAEQPVMPGEDEMDECTTNAQCNAIVSPIPTPTGGWPTFPPQEPTSGPGQPTTPPTQPTTPPGQPTTPPQEPTTPPANKCSNECPELFECYSNGSEHRWFVEGYVMQGFEKTAVNDCVGVRRPTFLGKAKGDANCDGSINIYDRGVWTEEYVEDRGRGTVRDNWHADFNCDKKVDIYDRSIWTENYTSSMGQ